RRTSETRRGRRPTRRSRRPGWTLRAPVPQTRPGRRGTPPGRRVARCAVGARSSWRVSVRVRFASSGPGQPWRTAGSYHGEPPPDEGLREAYVELRTGVHARTNPDFA